MGMGGVQSQSIALSCSGLTGAYPVLDTGVYIFPMILCRPVRTPPPPPPPGEILSLAMHACILRGTIVSPAPDPVKVGILITMSPEAFYDNFIFCLQICPVHPCTCSAVGILDFGLCVNEVSVKQVSVNSCRGC